MGTYLERCRGSRHSAVRPPGQSRWSERHTATPERRPQRLGLGGAHDRWPVRRAADLLWGIRPPSRASLLLRRDTHRLGAVLAVLGGPPGDDRPRGRPALP